MGRDVVGVEPGELAGLAGAQQVRVLDLEAGGQRVGDDEAGLDVALGGHGDDGDQPVVEGDGGGIGGRAVEGQELALDAVAVALRRLGLGRDAEGGDDGERRVGAGVGDRSGRSPGVSRSAGPVAGASLTRRPARAASPASAWAARSVQSCSWVERSARGRGHDAGERGAVDGVAAGFARRAPARRRHRASPVP